MSPAVQNVEYRKEKFFQMVNTILFFLDQSAIKEISQMYLHKILWYADFIAYRDWGKSISGFDYQANKHGPTNKFLDKSGFPIGRQVDNKKFYIYRNDLPEKNSLKFHEIALLAEVCVLLAPWLKDESRQTAFYDFIHQKEPAYKNTWDKNPRGDISYTDSDTIQIDSNYRQEALTND